MSNILELIQKERDRIRAKRGVQDLEPERYLSILVEEVGEVAQAINEWREKKRLHQERNGRDGAGVRRGH